MTTIGFIKAVIPKTHIILNRFEPNKFPKEIAFSFFKTATKQAASSGILVPTETTVIPMTLSLTPIWCAIEIDPSTRISDPKDNNILPNKQYKKMKAQLKLVVRLLS